MRRTLLVSLMVLGCGGPADPPAEQPVEPPTTDSGTPTTDTGTSGTSRTSEAPQNVLLLIIDDMGVDKLALYEHPSPEFFPATPNIDRLAEEGLTFTNAWAAPNCSPSRAQMLTGRLPRRTGVGGAYDVDEPLVLSYDEVTLPEFLDAHTGGAYASVGLGKWHLTSFLADYADNPLKHGFSSYKGSIFNFTEPAFDGQGTNYFTWEKAVDGQITWVEETYATTDTVDDALAAFRDLPEPWFLWVAFNAPHEPFHVPPAELHQDPGLTPDSSDLRKFDGSIQALDTEIGRLLSGLPAEQRDHTTVILVSDNGTPYKTAAWLPEDRAKSSLYEGGLRVPLIVTSPLLARPGARTDALVMGTDVFATVAELAGIDDIDGRGVELDSVSFVPYLRDPDLPSLREYAVAEKFTPNGFGPYEGYRRAIRDERWKLHVHEEGGVAQHLLYDLTEHPSGFEVHDLITQPGGLDPDQQTAYDRLLAALEQGWPAP